MASWSRDLTDEEKERLRQKPYIGGDGGGYGTLDQIRRFQEIQSRYLKLISEQLVLMGRPVRLLDIGAGEGYLKKLSAPWGWIYEGLDPLPDAGHVKKGKIADAYGGDDYYDIVVYNHVMEHVVSPDMEVAWAARKLQPGGILFIAVPDGDLPWSWEIPAHIWRYNQNLLHKLVARHGLVGYETFKLCFRKDNGEIWFVARKPEK